MTRDEAIGRIKARFDKWALDDEDMKAIQTLIPELSESEDERIRKEINILYSDIDACITELLKARTDKDSESEGKALFKMEGLMVATLQDLSCIEDYLEKQKEQKSNIEKFEDISTVLLVKKEIERRIETWQKGRKEALAMDCNTLADDAAVRIEELYSLISFLGTIRCGTNEKQKEQNGEDEECTDFTIYYPLKNEKGEYECIPYSFYDSLTFFSEDKDLIDFHRACFYTEEECNEWIEQQKEQKPVDYDHEMWKNCEANFEGGKKEVIDHPEKYGLQKPAEWSEDTIRKAVKEVGLTQHQIDWFKNNVFPPKPEWSEEDEKKLERVDDLLWMLDDYLGNDCSICEEKTARLRDEIHNELFPWLEFLRPQYHGDVTMTEAYKMGLEAGKASSLKPSEEQTNNVIVELTRIELGDIINGLYYLKEKYYEDCKEHNGTATMGLSDEFKFYFKRFNEVLDLYTRLHELEKEKYGTTTDGYYYE